MNTGNKYLKQLDKIYLHKRRVAERLFSQQQQLVMRSVAELADITASVQSLRAQLLANSAYMRNESVCSNAEKMVGALNYKGQIDYDIQREEYFRMLADEELQTQRIELDRCRFAIKKIKIRRETIGNKIRKNQVLKDSQEEIDQEDDFAQIRVIANV